MNKLQMQNQILSHLNIMDKVGMDWAHKGTAYIGLAFEYFNMQEDEKGADLLVQIPHFYFEKHMIEELKRNSEFMEVTNLLLDLMMKSQFVEKDSQMMKAFFKLKGNQYGNT